MTDMNFKLVLELVDKASSALQKVTGAQEKLNANTKAANAANQKTAVQIAHEMRKQAEATQKAADAQKALESAAKAAGSASADAASDAARATEKATGALQRLRSASAAAGHALSSAFHKAAQAATSSGHIIARAGSVAGKGFAQGVSHAIKQEMPNILRHIWGGMTGGPMALMSSPRGQAFRARARQALSTGVTQGSALARAAGAMAYSNVQGAIHLDEQLRPDMGVEGARRMRAAADRYLLASPFSRDDIRSTLPAAARMQLMPGSREWNALMDAAAATKQTPAQAIEAWEAAKKGDYSGMEAFGIKAKTDDNDKARSLMYNANGAAQNVAVNGDAQGAIIDALEARFKGAGDRSSMTIDGAIMRGKNAWDAFIGRVMDSGPYDFVLGKLNEIFDELKKATGATEGGLAENIGKQLTEVLKGGYDLARDITVALKALKDVLEPVAQAVGGWKIAFEGLIALRVLGWMQAILAPLSFLTTAFTINTAAISAATAAAWRYAAALAANPVTWIVAGLLALAAAVYLVYKNWDTIGPAIARAWEAIKAAVSAGISAVGAMISAAWDGVTGAISAAWTAIKTAVSTGISAVVDVIAGFGGKALAAIKAAFEPVVGWFDSAVGKIKDIWKGVSDLAGKAASYIGIGSDDPNAKLISDAGRASEATALLNDLQTKMAEVRNAVANFDVAGPLTAAIGAARVSIASISFYNEGVAMMKTLADGIAAGAAHAVSAVARVTQQMRDYLPHSPAKVGPLSDLDEVRFSETLATAIRPEPAIAAVRAVAAGMAGAMSPRIGVLAAQAEGGGGLVAGGAGAPAGGATHLNFAPVIHAAGGDARSIIEHLRPLAYELAQMVAREQRQSARLNFQEA
ncbi:MAG: hypothetical protein KGL46_04045 [Hyphomicrobiales bacterium]|nr:hypothetical protein [Hyphomicrobiales bacterium]